MILSKRRIRNRLYLIIFSLTIVLLPMSLQAQYPSERIPIEVAHCGNPTVLVIWQDGICQATGAGIFENGQVLSGTQLIQAGHRNGSLALGPPSVWPRDLITKYENPAITAIDPGFQSITDPSGSTTPPTGPPPPDTSLTRAKLGHARSKNPNC